MSVDSPVIKRLVTRLEHAETPATATTTTTADDDECNTPSQSESATADNPDTHSSPMTIEQQLELAMRQSVASTSAASGGQQTRDRDKKLDAAIKAEMAVYESSGKRGRSLEEAYRLPLPSNCSTYIGGSRARVFGSRCALH